MAQFTASQPLWDFALAFYAQPKMAETCVHLQDAFQVNVCLLIGLRWMDDCGKFLSNDELADLHAHIECWSTTVVESLRSLRRLLKQPVAGYSQDETQMQLRTTIKQAELLAEKKLLFVIEVWATQPVRLQPTGVNSNVENYLLALGVSQYEIELLQGKF